MKYALKQDERLGVMKPVLFVPYEELSDHEQAEFELMCQKVCAKIPEAIKTLERTYMDYFEQLDQVDETRFYDLMGEMNEISSCICDLNLLYLWIEGNFLAKSVHA
jgi:hypothetical protein